MLGLVVLITCTRSYNYTKVGKMNFKKTSHMYEYLELYYDYQDGLKYLQ